MLQRATHTAKRIVEAFLLREPEKVATARTAIQQEQTARYHAAALHRIRGARELQHSDPVAAIALYREAAVLLIGAIRQAAQPERVEVASSAVEAWRSFDDLPLLEAARPDELTRARGVLESTDPLAPDAIPPGELGAVTAAAAETVDWLASAIEPRSPKEIRASRFVRVGGTLLAAVVAAYVVVGELYAPKNLARNRPVTASSQRPGTPAPSGAVNGELESNYGVHTNVENNPWVRVDLGTSLAIHEVRVHNRGEAYESEILPLLLQLSDDDETYTDVEERTELFTRSQPWVAKLDGRTARYVRVYMPKQGYIALTEIEVY
jgi:hypothetical protein